MGWFILAQVLTILISIARIGRMSEQEKDLEILILRQQLAILQRKQMCSNDTASYLRQFAADPSVGAA